MDIKESVTKQTASGLHLAKQLLMARFKSSNLVFSPLSVHVVLSLVAAGASGPTLEQLLAFLNAKSVEELNSLFLEMATVVLTDRSPSGGPKLSLANGVWINDSMTLMDSFKRVVNDVYKAVVSLADFTAKPAEVETEVNQWVEKETNGLINGIIPAGSLSADTALVLVSALYFKAKWEYEFDEDITRDRDFFLLDGSIVRVPFMSSDENQAIGVYDGFKVLGLPYKMTDYKNKDEHRFWMYLFLPDAGDGLSALSERLCSESDFLDGHIPSKFVKVRVIHVPKFKISSKFEASQVVRELGLVLPFSGGMTEMVEPPEGAGLAVSRIFHKSFIEVNEQGTEAAAVSEVEVELGCSFYGEEEEPRLEFIADHPFLFVIRENKTGMVLFAGQVSNPIEE